jgi:uncharacterized protein (DUF58 family)
VELYIPPKKGSRHVLRLIRELLYFKMPRRKTDITLALDYLAKVTRKRATIFLVSDFMEASFQKSLSLLHRRHDVIAVPVRDRAEIGLPNVGLVELQDAETGEVLLVDTSNGSFGNRYKTASGERFDQLTGLLRSTKVDSIPIYTDRPYMQDLIQFFHTRHRRR